jgi:DUF971 family protein
MASQQETQMALAEFETEEVRLSQDRQVLSLSRAGARVDFTASALREACRCAACVRARHDGTPPHAAPGLAITGIDPIGAQAANIQFSDGHARGIFPWVYLWQLAATPDTAKEPA